MGSKSKTPAAPDYTAAANATAAGNLEAARQAATANRVNTYTPYGSLTYSQTDPSNPDVWRSDVNLSDTGKSLLESSDKTSLALANLQGDATAKVAGMLGQPLPSTYDPTKATNNASELINARLAPQQARDKATLETQLSNQGLAPGSEAWTTAMDQLGQTQNDAKQQAELAGINLGQNQQQQSWTQETATRNTPMNELNAIRTGSQVTNPTFSNAPQQQTTAGADLLGAANSQYGAALDSSNASNAASGNMMSGLFKIGSAAMMSDRRLKTDIRRVGTLDNGLPVYIYRYKSGGPFQMGVMAQEAEKVVPYAVVPVPGDFLAVNYEVL